MFTACVEWKLRKDNPCREVPKIHEPDRDRHVFDDGHLAVYNLAPKEMETEPGEMIQCAMDLATITGQREDDILKLPLRDPRVYTSEGLVFPTSRSGATRDMGRSSRHPKSSSSCGHPSSTP